ncbi:MAG TPA: peptidylprolyl isomerase, partial [Phenylobacterium sp.]|nr:peptidylprolyl isomerase [Phenylobacterium sp.]
AEFFICIGDNPALDFGGQRNPDGQGFAAFGKVVEGMGVVKAINAARADLATPDAYVRGQLLSPPVKILSVKRLAPCRLSWAERPCVLRDARFAGPQDDEVSRAQPT